MPKRKQFFILWVFMILTIALTVSFSPNAGSIESVPSSGNNSQFLIDLYKAHYHRATSSYFSRTDINLFVKSLNHDEVIKFFTQFTKNKAISESIIKWALHYNVPINLCFALANTESEGFIPTACGYNRDQLGRITSIDRGLFQLNSLCFNLTAQQFFDIDTNCNYGIRYLSECLRNTETAPLALIAYNMGLSVAQNGRVPDMREEYVNKILAYEAELDMAFNSYAWRK